MTLLHNSLSKREKQQQQQQQKRTTKQKQSKYDIKIPIPPATYAQTLRCSHSMSHLNRSAA